MSFQKYVMIGLMIVVIASCAKPPSLREISDLALPSQPTNESSDSPPADQPTNSQKTPSQADNEPEDDGELTAKDILKAPAIVKVTIKGESSEIDGTFYGKSEVFTVPYTDIDAIIFDIARKFGASLNEVRQALYVDGRRYLKPAEAQQIEEEANQAEVFNQTKSNPFSNISYSFVRPATEEGLVRAVGCDMSRSILKYQLHNFKNDTVKRYRDVKPKIQSPLTIYFNGKRLMESYCDGYWELEPNQTVDCYHSGVTFVRSPHSGSIYSEIELNEDLQDELVATQPGYNEKFRFMCEMNITLLSNVTNTTG